MKKLLLLVVIVSLVGSANATLVTNGDFETGDGSGWVTSGTANATYSAWVAPNYTGGYYAYVIGNGVLAQTLGETATASGHYQLDFDIVTQEIVGPGNASGDSLKIWLQETTGWSLLGGEQTVAHNNAAAIGEVTHHTVDFIWTGETHIGAPLDLIFQRGAGSAGYVLIDNVVLTPEPMTMALLGLGGLFLRRRKC